MNIVILDGYTLNPGDLSWTAIKSMGEVTLYDRTDQQDIVERSKDADIVLTNKVPFSRQTIEQLPKLKFIAVLATGYNIIDTKAAREHGITVSNIPAYSTASVAQMVMAQLLTISNRVEHYTQQITQQRRWSKNPDFCYWDTNLIELEGKRIGIYGMGQIGMAVARAAMGLGMKVVTCTSKSPESLPHISCSDYFGKHDAKPELADEETFWQTCDIYTLHCPLTPHTDHLINDQRISKMKQGAIIVNTSRGPVVDEQAVADALHSGHLAAFAGDVLSAEPASEGNPLLSAPNVFLTPHIAWATFEARTRLMNILIQNIKAFITGAPINVVN